MRMTTTEVADYTIGFDADRNLVTIHATGFWDREMLGRFGDELIAEMRRVGARGAPFGVLADASDFPVQSIPVSLGFMDIVRRVDRSLLVPTAVVTKSVLLRLQALHVFVAPHIKIFDSVAAAHEWLAGAIATDGGTRAP